LIRGYLSNMMGVLSHFQAIVGYLVQDLAGRKGDM